MVKSEITFEIKGMSDAGYFEGLLSSYGNVDQGGDMVMPGAFAKTMKDHGAQVPMLWQHKADCPIGTLTLEDRAEGLWCKGQLLLEVDEAKKAYALIKAGVVKGLSIGFSTIKDAVEGSVRKLKELRLYEGSVVTFPMSLPCEISMVKHQRPGQTKGDFTEEMSEIQIQDMGHQMRSALYNALGSLPWASGVTRDEKITAAQTIIEQFSVAFMDYLPKYLDWLSVEYGAEFEMMSRAPVQVKSGRTISAATASTLKSAHEHMKSATDLIYPLLECDAEDDDCENQYANDGITSKSKAGTEEKPAPVVDHSALDALLNDMRAKHAA